jgi:molybdopterin-guanine dinucleotide biosynthesis protein B
LLTAMLPLLRARGLTVSTVKHTHHGFDMDRPGKDTFRHREAGAQEVLVASGTRWALLHEVSGTEPRLPELLARLQPVDLVLVEGFKTHPFPKLEVHRPALGKPPIWRTEHYVVAVAADGPLASCNRTLLPLNDPEAVVAWLMQFLALELRAS